MGFVVAGNVGELTDPIAVDLNISPSAVVDLALIDVDGLKASLNWTSVGDDGSHGIGKCRICYVIFVPYLTAY